MFSALRSNFSKKLLETHSKFNGRITVLEDIGGRRRVVTETVDGQKLSQSGYLVQKIWEIALSSVILGTSATRTPESAERDSGQAGRRMAFSLKRAFPSERTPSILILGLGAGSIVDVIQDKWPDATIDAVEIDPVMIAIGKKYFNLSMYDISIYHTDAETFVRQPKAGAYDLICVDLFHGDQAPPFLSAKDWLGHVARLLANDGVAMFNLLYYGAHRKQAKLHLDKLKQVFLIEKLRILPSRFVGTNLCVVASRQKHRAASGMIQ